MKWSDSISLVDSLKCQEYCPKCGVNWKVLEESLWNFRETENRLQSLVIVDNCDVCWMRFRKERRK